MQQWEEHLNHQSPTWAVTMNRISSQALEWQKNHEDNGDGVTSNNKQWKEHDHVEKLWPLSLSPITPNSGSNVLDKFKVGIGYVVGCCQSSKFIFAVVFFFLFITTCYTINVVFVILLSCTCTWWYSFIVVAHVGGCGVFLVVTTCHCLGITLLLFIFFIFLWYWSSSSWSFCCYSQ